jgi:hypothetical protein
MSAIRRKAIETINGSTSESFLAALRQIFHPIDQSAKPAVYLADGLTDTSAAFLHGHFNY